MTAKNTSRVSVNLIGIPSILAIIVVGDTLYQLPLFSAFIIGVLFLGAMEIPALTSGKGAKPIIPLLLLFLVILQVDRHPAISWDIDIHLLVLGITLISMILELFRKHAQPLLNISILVFAFIWLGLMLGSLPILRNLQDIGFRMTFALFLSVWICDTSAFFFGKKFGKAKIIPNISPNKTWIGTIMGFISSIIFMFFLYHCKFFNEQVSSLDALIIGIITGGFGQLGDWVESMLKREAGLKDTSNILKGHGGILDRFDSLAFSAPLTFIYCKYFISNG